ncbi:MAG: CopD family protein [Alphaproteobacteria bacterium]|nr:CopD family protein [Alphaproteobacteria bacterium]
MALIVARALSFLCGALALGIPAVLAFAVLPPMLGAERLAGERSTAMLRRLLGLTAAAIGLGLLSGALWLVVTAASMSGRSIAAAAAPAVLWPVLLQTHFGIVAMVRAALAIVELLCLSRVLGAGTARRGIAVLAAASLAGAAGFAAIAWAGHAVATPGLLHLLGDAAHLLAAGLWIGGLVVLAALLGTVRRDNDSAWAGIVAAATQRFSLLGLACVLVLLASGIINSWFLVGTLPALLGTDYGHLLLMKIALFAAMVAVAAVNRFRLTPRLEEAARRKRGAGGAMTARSLRSNAIGELAMGILILAIVGALGTLPPGLHDQPWWPFAWRFTDEALELPAVRNEIVIASAMIVTGLVVFGIGMARRRHRLLAIPIGLGLIACFVPSFRLLTAEAYPTSFYHPEAAYTVDSVAHGAQLYAENCAACHGLRAKGDGPGAEDLRVRPADLTAAHVLDHSEGDLFWWLTAGIPESGMPGFAGHLSAANRWDLVNWVRTLPVGGLDDGLTPEISDMAPRAPDFSFVAADGSETAMSSLLSQGPLLLVLFTAPDSQARLQELEAVRASLSKAGLQILALPLGDQGDAGKAAAESFVATAGPAVSEIYRVIATARADKAPPAPTHLEFLIDRDGYLRALWQPGESPGWQDSGALADDVRQLATRPVTTSGSGMPMDMHMQMN